MEEGQPPPTSSLPPTAITAAAAANTASTVGLRSSLSAYDVTLKKLIGIFKQKASDNLKQLEELWDSFNHIQQQQQQLQTLPQEQAPNIRPVGSKAFASNSASKSPVHVGSSDNSNDSTSSTKSMKRDSVRVGLSPPPAGAPDAKKLKPSLVSVGNSSSSSVKKALISTLGNGPASNAAVKGSANNINSSKSSGTKVKASSGEINKASSTTKAAAAVPSVSSARGLNGGDQAKTLQKALVSSSSSPENEINQLVEEMLQSDERTTALGAGSSSLLSVNASCDPSADDGDFTLYISCSTCKQYNQELNNKLIECRKCTRLYHQTCHMPPIEAPQICEQAQPPSYADCNRNANGNIKRMAWFFEECSTCAAGSRSGIVSSPISHEEKSLRVNIGSNSTLSSSSFAAAATVRKSPPTITHALVVTPQTQTSIHNGGKLFFKRESNKSTDNLSHTAHESSTVHHHQSHLQHQQPSTAKQNNVSSSSVRFSNLANIESVELANHKRHQLLTSHHQQTLSQQQQQSSTAAKGFAALATKFNVDRPNGIGTSSTTTAAVANMAPQSSQQGGVLAAVSSATATSVAAAATSTSSKVNHDDLFKKFRQSVGGVGPSNGTSNNNGIAVNGGNGYMHNGSLAKRPTPTLSDSSTGQPLEVTLKRPSSSNLAISGSLITQAAPPANGLVKQRGVFGVTGNIGSSSSSTNSQTVTSCLHPSLVEKVGNSATAVVVAAATSVASSTASASGAVFNL